MVLLNLRYSTLNDKIIFIWIDNFVCRWVRNGWKRGRIGRLKPLKIIRVIRKKINKGKKAWRLGKRNRIENESKGKRSWKGEKVHVKSYKKSRGFTNDPGDRGSILGRVIPKTQKMVLDAFLLNTQYNKVEINGKCSNPGKGVAPSSTSQCSSYWKWSLRVGFDYGRPTCSDIKKVCQRFQIWYLFFSHYSFSNLYIHMYIMVHHVFQIF